MLFNAKGFALDSMKNTVLGDDIHTQGAFEQALKGLLIDLSLEAAFVCDEDFKIRFINASAEALTGYSMSELVGHSVSLLIPEGRRSVHDAMMRAFSAGSFAAIGMRERRPINCLHKKGRLVSVSATVTQIPTEQGLFFGVLLQDLTEQDRLLEKYEESQRTLSRAHEELTTAMSARSHFLAKASHELRTPLNAIVGFGEVIKDWDGSHNPDSIRDYGRFIFESGHKLTKLVSQILEFSEVHSEQQESVVQTVSLQEMVQSVFEYNREKADTANVSLELELGCPCDIAVDYPRFSKAIGNVLDNAIRYTPDGGNVTLAHDHHEDGRPRITISDTGYGVRADIIDRLTLPFEQFVESKLGFAEGMGLGLSTAKAVIAMHGGELAIESVLDEGTIVTILLPQDCVVKTQEHRALFFDDDGNKNTDLFYI